jgi:uracil-DNA glycosylase family 4
VSKLIHEIKSCNRCPELALSRTRAIPGDGPIPCNFVCIGAAPNSTDDATGIPFNDLAGRYVRHLLKLETVLAHYLTITKCQTPDKRDPTQKEIKNCSKFLRLQLEEISPKVVLALGRSSTACLLGTHPSQVRMLKYAGAIIPSAIMPDGNDALTVCTFHPSFVFQHRKSEIEQLFRQHVRKALTLAVGRIKETPCSAPIATAYFPMGK